jgi:hypothetical protein
LKSQQLGKQQWYIGVSEDGGRGFLSKVVNIYLILRRYIPHDDNNIFMYIGKDKGKDIPVQAMEAHRVARG